MKSKLRLLTTALLTICALWLSARPVRAQDPVTISAADFQRLVYSANLHSQLAVKPDLEACLRVLLEMQRRNPNADPAALANLSRQALMLYRTSAPAYIGTNGFPDEILAAYLGALRQIPARTNFVQANLTLLNGFMLSPADYNSSVAPATLFSTLVDAGNQRLLQSEDTALERQALVDNCAARAQGNPAFAAAMDSLLLPETLVALGDTPAEIIANTNSLLHGNLTMQTMLGLTNSDGGLTVSSNQLMNLFTNEMQTIWNTTQTNLALLAAINQSQPDFLAYLTNQPAVNANMQLVAATQQGQPGQIASATAAVFFQSALLQDSQKAAQIDQAVGIVAKIGWGIGKLCFGKVGGGVYSLVSGGYSAFEFFKGGTAQDQAADQYANMKTLMGDLSTNQNYRFDRIDQSLTTIFNTLNEQFNKIDITIDAQGQKIAQLNGNVDDIRSSLVGVQAKLDRIEGELFTDFNAAQRQSLLTEMNGSLFYETQNPSLGPMTSAIYSDASGPENNFYTYATTLASGPLSSPTYTAGQLGGSGLENQFSVFPLDANLNYISEFLSTTLGQTTAGNPPLANPRDWFTGAYAYLQLATENPVNFREKGVRVPAIINTGQNLTNFLGSLTFIGTNINWPLYTALLANYNTNQTNFLAQVQATEQAYGTLNGFAVDTWRAWDIAAPRVAVTNTASGTNTKVVYAPQALPPLTRFATRIEAGDNHSLALKADGTVLGWGDNSSGQISIPASLTNVLEIAAKVSDSLALKADGTVIAWGNNGWGQIDIPASATNVMKIAAGGGHNLALKADGTVIGWGYNDNGQTNIPSGLSNVVAIAAGWAHSLALLTNGTVVGWGYNSDGEATGVPSGSPPTYSATGIVAVAGQTLTNVVAIAGGDYHSLALLTDGTVVGWGGNWYGQATGVPNGPSGRVLLAGQPLSNVVAIAAGLGHSMALKNDGTIVAWGDNSYRQCLLPGVLSWRGAIALGASHTNYYFADSILALQGDGTVLGWGDNTHGQIIIPAAATNLLAAAEGLGYSLALKADGTVVAWGSSSALYGLANTASLRNVVAIAAGDYHSLALLADGTVVGWGNNDSGQTNIPSGLTNAVAIAAGFAHSLALQADGTVVAWGDNSHGQTNIPPSATNLVAIAAGDFHSLALKADTTVVGWGNNDSGQSDIPPGLTNVVAIAAGSRHSLALKADGTVFGWGDNSQWEATGPYPIHVSSGPVLLGGQPLTNVVAIAATQDGSLALQADGTIVAWGYVQYPPIVVPPPALTNVKAIASGGELSSSGSTLYPWPSAFGLALLTNGTVVGWGYNFWGQATGVRSGSPPYGATGIVAVAGLTLTNVVAIAAGFSHSLALKADGTVVGWGENSYGQATGAPTDPSGPVFVGGQALSDVVAIAAGPESDHSLALKADGTVVGWGDNSSGQINIPSGLGNVVAIAAGYSHSLALKADGTVVDWGDNSYGQTNIPSGLRNVVAIAGGGYHSLALKADGTVVGWGDNSLGETNVPVSVSNVVAIAAGGFHSLALKADGTVVGWGANSLGQATGMPVAPPNYSSSGLVTLAGQALTNVVAIAGAYDYSLFLQSDSSGQQGQSLTFLPAQIPARIPPLFEAVNANTIAELNQAGPLLDSANALSGSKALLTAVLELGLPYTLEQDNVLHGLLYGDESIMDLNAATNFLYSANSNLQATPDALPPLIDNVAGLSLQAFAQRLTLDLQILQTNGQPEIPRLVGHTLRLLNLLQDSYAAVPRSSLEISSLTNSLGLVLYGEPYARYTLQQSSNLTGWANTTIANLRSADSPVGIVSTNLPTTLAPALYYRAAQ